MNFELKTKETTFTCNRYIYSDHCVAGVQVEVATTSRNVLMYGTLKRKIGR